MLTEVLAATLKFALTSAVMYFIIRREVRKVTERAEAHARRVRRIAEVVG